MASAPAVSLRVTFLAVAIVFGSSLRLLPAESETAALIPRHGRLVLSEADRGYWAFQAVRPLVLPTVRDRSQVLNAIDVFLLARLEEKGLQLNPIATPREQVRRLFFDVLGLPPDPEDVERFEKDPSPKAWDHLVDTLLSSPHYGERWGRHWLDLVRFAESNGYERDGAKPEAWRYRDYVIEAFNQDKPYDQFIQEQLAGDELAMEWMKDPNAPRNRWESALIATGFFRLHIWDDEPDSTLVAEFDDLDDILSTTGTAFLGLTVGCARCHDHKFDPISQADYYSMLSFVRNVDPYGQHHTGGGGRGTGKILTPLATPEELSRWRADQQSRVKGLESRLAGAPDPARKKPIEEELQRVKQESAPFPMALAVAEMGRVAKPTHILGRGQVSSPGAEVGPRFPEVMGLPAPVIPEPAAASQTSGRRQHLARWIASPSNPLTARVMANRVWQHHFGTGLVATPDDFGRTGTGCSHPALLDYLASEFVRSGWSLKQLHKLILSSHAYRMSSRTDRPEALRVDEANRLFWRQSLRRNEAEVLRDTFLKVSGRLNLESGGPSVFPTLPAEVHRTQDSAGKGWVDSSPDEQRRRSVYLVVKRALKVPLLETFDFANCTSPMGARSITTIAPQALMVLNDEFVHEQARALADSMARASGGDYRRKGVERCFRTVLQRPASNAELAAAMRFLEEQRAEADRSHLSEPDRVAFVSFCRSMLNLSETIYVD